MALDSGCYRTPGNKKRGYLLPRSKPSRTTLTLRREIGVRSHSPQKKITPKIPPRRESLSCFCPASFAFTPSASLSSGLPGQRRRIKGAALNPDGLHHVAATCRPIGHWSVVLPPLRLRQRDKDDRRAVTHRFCPAFW